MYTNSFVKLKHITPEILEELANNRRFLEDYGILKPQIKTLMDKMKEIFVEYNLVDLFDELK